MTTPGTPDFSNALTAMQSILNQWGLGDLTQLVQQMLVDGDSTDVIPLKLRETPQYQTKFAANIARTKAGYSQLSEADFLSTQDTLSRTLASYIGNNPTNQSMVDSWITNDVSASEANTRLTAYQQNYQQQPQIVKDYWQAHGMTPQDAVRVMADPTVNVSDLQTKLTAGTIGGMAAQAFHNINALSVDQATNYAQQGVTEQQAQKGLNEVAQRSAMDQQLARSQGVKLSTTDEENESLLNDQNAAATRQKVYNTDQAQFNENFMSTNSAAKKTAGQY